MESGLFFLITKSSEEMAYQLKVSALSLLWLWLKFDPQAGNFYMLQTQQKKKKKRKSHLYSQPPESLLISTSPSVPHQIPLTHIFSSFLLQEQPSKRNKSSSHHLISSPGLMEFFLLNMNLKEQDTFSYIVLKPLHI